MGKRILLFLLTNLAIVVMLSIVLSVLGVGGYIGPGGLDIGSLAVFCFIWGMGGAFISLQMSRFIAKRATGARLVDGRTGDAEADWLFATVARLTQTANLPMPEVGIYEGPPNAFATGAFKNSALVAVSTGLLQSMTREEVEAKFLGNAALAVPEEQSARVVRIVGDLAAQAHITALMDSLTA